MYICICIIYMYKTYKYTYALLRNDFVFKPFTDVFILR